MAGYVALAMLSLLAVGTAISYLTARSIREDMGAPALDLFEECPVSRTAFVKHWGSEVSSDCGDEGEVYEHEDDQVRGGKGCRVILPIGA